MKLIDAEQMEKHIMESKVFTQYFKELVQALIWGEDAVDAVPVVRGEWIQLSTSDNEYVGQECSVCHEIQYGFDNFRIYCAFCGAKMQGDTTDE